MTKSTKNMLTILACCLVMCLALGFVGWMTSGFTDFERDSISDKFAPKMNEDNLIYKEFLAKDAYTNKSGNDGNGLTWTVNDDGSITVNGKADADSTFVLCDITLKTGEYTFTAVDGGSKNSYFVQGKVNDSVVWYSDWENAEVTSANKTFTEGTKVTISIVVKSGTEMKNVTFYPVIVEGGEAGNYYA